jgi:hypothetical protein
MLGGDVGDYYSVRVSVLSDMNYELSTSLADS